MTEMTRVDPATVQDTTYDLVVAGAGINGVAVAREAALRGLRVLVLDKGDLAGGTSAWSSRLIHGGLRYLEHAEIRLVRESLRDREALFRIAPHLVRPLPFVIPVYRHNAMPGWMFRIGMHLYDALSLGKSVPRHRALNRKDVRVELPSLGRDGLRGALRYYDGQVAYAERLVLETMLDAAGAGAQLMTYAAAERVVVEHGRATGVRVRDHVSGRTLTARGAVVVNATGPWADDLTAPLGDGRMIGGTKGTHLVVEAFPGAPDTAVYYEARSDGRAILVIPWNGRYLIGTTDDRFDGDLDTVAGTDAERDYLLAETNDLIPGARLTPDDVVYSYAGVRPLPYRPSGSTGSIPRSHLIVGHQQARGLVSIVGGKLTPHLSLAREVVDQVAELLGRRLPPSGTDRRPLPGAVTHPGRPAPAAPADWPEPLRARLAAVYGARVRELADLVAGDPSQGRIIAAGGQAVVVAELTLAVRREAALHLTDILHRRTMVGLEPGHAVGLDVAVAHAVAPLLGWDDAAVAAEIDRHRRYVERLRGGTAG